MKLSSGKTVPGLSALGAEPFSERGVPGFDEGAGVLADLGVEAWVCKLARRCDQPEPLRGAADLTIRARLDMTSDETGNHGPHSLAYSITTGNKWINNPERAPSQSLSSPPSTVYSACPGPGFTVTFTDSTNQLSVRLSGAKRM
jgi:hypothetical protein